MRILRLMIHTLRDPRRLYSLKYYDRMGKISGRQSVQSAPSDYGSR